MNGPTTGEHAIPGYRDTSPQWPVYRARRFKRRAVENALFFVVLVLVAASGVRHARQAGHQRCEAAGRR